MDFRGIESVVARHTPDLDALSQDWLGLAANPLHYLSDENKMAALADQAGYYEMLEPMYEIAKEHLKTIAEGKTTLEEFQAWYADARQKALKKIGESVHKARKSNAQLRADFEVLDAKDRSDLTKIEQKKRNDLEFIAKELVETLRIEAYKHANKIQSQERRFTTEQEREKIRASLTERRQQLAAKLRYGTRSLPGSEQQPVSIPVQMSEGRRQGFGSTFGGWGGRFGQMWSRFKRGMAG